MNRRTATNSLNIEAGKSAIATFMTQVYQWMTIGILLTAAVAYYIGNDEEVAMRVFTTPGLMIGAIIFQLGIVIGLSFFINKLSAAVASILFIIYSLITGLTFSTLFLAYTQGSIHSAFLTTAIGFFGLTVFGYTTKKDLGPIGTFCMMGLFGLIGYGLLSMFFPSLQGGTMGLVYNLAGLLIFCGLTAYDTQKIKKLGLSAIHNGETKSKMIIISALTLYLDFINLFLYILRMSGNRRN